MSFTDERLALLNVLIEDVAFIPTQYPNTAVLNADYEPTSQNDQLWRRITINRGPATAWTAGKNGKDEINGVMEVDVFAPKGSGDLEATEHADLIASAAKWRNLEQNGFCLHTRGVTVSPMPASENWYGVKVSIQFRSYPKRS